MAADEELVAANDEEARAGGHDLSVPEPLAYAAGEVELEGAEKDGGEEPEMEEFLFGRVLPRILDCWTCSEFSVMTLA